MHRECLKIYPNSVWTLVGVRRCLEVLLKHAGADERSSLQNELGSVNAAIVEAHKHADIEVKVACFCARCHEGCHDYEQHPSKHRKVSE